MTTLTAGGAKKIVIDCLEKASVMLASFDERSYPEETIFIVYVQESDFPSAISIASDIDRQFQERNFSGFVTIRKSVDISKGGNDVKGRRGVANPKADDLANLLAARSRTSEIQPSLEYVRDVSNKLEVAVTPRNHLIFGRRGAGKTTLMVEAKSRLEKDGHVAVWVNMQTHRHSPSTVVFLWVVQGVVERLQIHFGERMPLVLAELSSLQQQVNSLLSKPSVSKIEVTRIIPHVQKIVKRFVAVAACQLYIFLDDLHYISRGQQPLLLDMVHGMTRDVDAWIKVACIKHLTRWFEHSPPTGLQTGHDADHIELDLTLESPTEAKEFLDRVLNVYSSHVGLASARSIFSEDAMNRLFLASGAVPRDYLVLAAATIRSAKTRQNARLAGVQDVNRAAGEQSKVKIAELEDDAASLADGGAKAIIRALSRVREFCLDETRFTFFKVDFRDKEMHQSEYALVQSLLDVRIVHLIASSLSDKREAGRRAEVFMLDLSQFTGDRFKKRIHVLDFVGSHLVLKETSSKTPDKKGDTSGKLLELLRLGPTLELTTLPT
jgi:AAA ATPase domain